MQDEDFIEQKNKIMMNVIEENAENETRRRSRQIMIRLNKFIADSGIASRRKAEELYPTGKNFC